MQFAHIIPIVHMILAKIRDCITLSFGSPNLSQTEKTESRVIKKKYKDLKRKTQQLHIYN